jgi:glycine cleavage system H protein
LLVAFEKRYTAAHEWIELSADAKTATIGISKYAADALGDVVYVELPTIDLEINSGDAIGAVESVKSASDIYSPVGGTVIEANLKLEEKPSLINQGPEGDGWIARIKLKEGGQEEVQGLMDTSAYREHTDE